MNKPVFHPQQYDLTSKELFKNTERGLVRWLTGQEPAQLQWLDVAFPTLSELKGDLVFQAQLAHETWVFHLELQSTNASNMPYRMIRYLSYLHEKYQLPVYQCVLYMGAQPLDMPQGLLQELDTHNQLNYRFRLLDMSQVSPEELVSLEEPAFLAFLPLSGMVKQNSETELQRCLAYLLAQAQALDLQQQRELLLRAEILSGLRFEQQTIEKIFQEVEQMLIIQESAGYKRIFEKGLEKGIVQGREEGREKGLEEGRQAGREEGRQEGRQTGRQEGLNEAEERFRQRIAEVLRKRFGPVPVALVERLQALRLPQLDQALGNALDADSLKAFEAAL